MGALSRLDYEKLDDPALAARVAVGDATAAQLVVRRNNQRLFRTAWSILNNRAEAEDAVQSAYLKAFAAIGTFEGRSSLSTWLTRIAANEALERRRANLRRKARLDEDSVVVMEQYRDRLAQGSATPSPDESLVREQIRQVLETAIGRLPDDFRMVFVLREVEGLSVEETAETLGVGQATIKTRHLRARRRLRADLDPELRTALEGAFPFAGLDCDALTRRVMQRFHHIHPTSTGDTGND